MSEPRLPPAFWLLFAGSLINRLGAFVLPLLALYLVRVQRFSPTQTGIVLSLYGLGSLCAGPLGGWLADRLGRRRTLLVALPWGAAAMLLVPAAHGLTAVGAAIFHLGLAGDLYRPAIHAAVADLCPPAARPRAFALLYWAVNLGFAISMAAGGFLARAGFGLLFVVDAATTLAYAALVALFLPETRAPARADPEPAGGGFAEVLADDVLLAFLATQVLVGVLFIQSTSTLPLTLQARGLGPDRYGLVTALNGVLIVLLQPFVARLSARARRTRALALAALLTGLGFGLNAPDLGLAGAAASVAVWTIGEMVGMPITPALVADLAPARLRGRYQGLAQMSWGLCALLGPALGMALLEHGSARLLWAACLGVGALAALVHLGSARRLRARLGGRGQPP